MDDVINTSEAICVGAILNDISNKFGLLLFFTLIPSHKTACSLGGCLVLCVLDFHSFGSSSSGGRM